MIDRKSRLAQLDIVDYLQEQTQPTEVYRLSYRVDILPDGRHRIFDYTSLPIEKRPASVMEVVV